MEGAVLRRRDSRPVVPEPQPSLRAAALRSAPLGPRGQDPTRSRRGGGGLHWDETRSRWIASITTGFDTRGKRITRRASGRTKTEAKSKLKQLLRDLDDGLPVPDARYTVADAITDWLGGGLGGLSPATIANYTTIAGTRIVRPLGTRQLTVLTATDVDRWLVTEAATAGTRTLRLMHSLLHRAVDHAMARDKVKRNVVGLCRVPTGRTGRPSKSLTLPQAEAVLAAADGTPMHAYIVLSLLTGARTEELRQLHWQDVDLRGDPDAEPPVPPSIAVVRSVRHGG